MSGFLEKFLEKMSEKGWSVLRRKFLEMNFGFFSAINSGSFFGAINPFLSVKPMSVICLPEEVGPQSRSNWNSTVECDGASGFGLLAVKVRMYSNKSVKYEKYGGVLCVIFS